MQHRLSSRLRALEEQGHRCPECGLSPEDKGNIVMIDEERPEESFKGDPSERCARCARFLYVVFRVVYDDEEGEGA